MNLFKFLKRDKPAVATEGPPAEVAKPKAPAAPVHVKTWEIKVPVGYVFADSEVAITQPFTITVEAGVRWHPEWKEPRVTVNVWRFFPMGDAVGWAGPSAVRAFESLLPAEVVALATYHGETVMIEGTEARNRRVSEVMERLGVVPPKVRQLLSTFIAHRGINPKTGKDQ